MEMRMKEPYIEGVAIHDGPEPCVGDPRGRSEALDRGVASHGCCKSVAVMATA
jgi:hypothetical protein